MEGEGHCTVGLEGGLVTLCQIETHGVMQTIVHSVMLSGHSVASMSKNILKTPKYPGYQLLKIGDHNVTFYVNKWKTIKTWINTNSHQSG